MLTRKSIDTDTLYNVSLALDYDFSLLYSIRKEQTNSDKEEPEYKISVARVLVELELILFIYIFSLFGVTKSF